MKLRCRASLYVGVALALASMGCSGFIDRIRAKSAFIDGTKAFKDENYKKAVESYEQAVRLNPAMAEAHFGLASAHQALFRPQRADDPTMRDHLDKALAQYKLALEANKGQTEDLKKLRPKTLAALVWIYSEPPYKNYDVAMDYAQQFVKDQPDSLPNIYAMGNLYEKFEKTNDAEALYRKAVDLNPKDIIACQNLANFYNKPLWNGKSRFEDTIQTQERCAALTPDDPGVWHKIAAFYWAKAYHDQEISREERKRLAERGLIAVERALTLNPEYDQALLYKNLLYRIMATMATTQREADRYIDIANELRDKAIEIQKKRMQAGTPTPPPA